MITANCYSAKSDGFILMVYCRHRATHTHTHTHTPLGKTRYVYLVLGNHYYYYYCYYFTCFFPWCEMKLRTMHHNLEGRIVAVS